MTAISRTPRRFRPRAGGGAKLVYLANPDNPMGSAHPGRVIEAALHTLPEGTLLALDEAYLEFAPRTPPPGSRLTTPA
jgi:histidinol-phosphate aminotransferase